VVLTLGITILLQSSLEQRLDDLDKAYQEYLEGDMPENEYDIKEDPFTDEFIETGRDFPQLLLTSFIVTWYSFVEQKLLDLCEKLKLTISVMPKDNRNLDKGIRRARTFLIEGQKYEIHPSHWQKLVEISKLRSFIVHKGTRMVGSYFPTSENMMALESGDGLTIYFPIKQSLYQYLDKQQIMGHTGMFLNIMPTFDYCADLVKFGKDLFSKLYKDLRV